MGWIRIRMDPELGKFKAGSGSATLQRSTSSIGVIVCVFFLDFCIFFGFKSFYTFFFVKAECT